MDPVLDVFMREPIMDPVLDVCVREPIINLNTKSSQHHRHKVESHTEGSSSLFRLRPGPSRAEEQQCITLFELIGILGFDRTR
jgi:hypothetical protein